MQPKTLNSLRSWSSAAAPHLQTTPRRESSSGEQFLRGNIANSSKRSTPLLFGKRKQTDVTAFRATSGPIKQENESEQSRLGDGEGTGIAPADRQPDIKSRVSSVQDRSDGTLHETQDFHFPRYKDALALADEGGTLSLSSRAQRLSYRVHVEALDALGRKACPSIYSAFDVTASTARRVAWVAMVLRGIAEDAMLHADLPPAKYKRSRKEQSVARLELLCDSEDQELCRQVIHVESVGTATRAVALFEGDGQEQLRKRDGKMLGMVRPRLTEEDAQVRARSVLNVELNWHFRFRPIIVHDVVGHTDSKAKLAEWMQRRVDGDPDVARSLLVLGPPGCGKRCLLEAMAREYGLAVRYADAQAQISLQRLAEWLERATQQTGVPSLLVVTAARFAAQGTEARCRLESEKQETQCDDDKMDEIAFTKNKPVASGRVITARDVAAFLRELPPSSLPIVFVEYDLDSPAVRELCSESERIVLQRLGPGHLEVLARRILDPVRTHLEDAYFRRELAVIEQYATVVRAAIAARARCKVTSSVEKRLDALRQEHEAEFRAAKHRAESFASQYADVACLRRFAQEANGDARRMVINMQMDFDTLSRNMSVQSQRSTDEYVHGISGGAFTAARTLFNINLGHDPAVCAGTMWSTDHVLPIAAASGPRVLPQDMRSDDDRIDLMDRLAASSDLVSLGDATQALRPPYSGMGPRAAVAWSFAQTVAWGYPRSLRGTDDRRKLPLDMDGLQFPDHLRSKVRDIEERLERSIHAYRCLHGGGTAMATREAVWAGRFRWKDAARTGGPMYSVDEMIAGANVCDPRVQFCALLVHKESTRPTFREWARILHDYGIDPSASVQEAYDEMLRAGTYRDYGMAPVQKSMSRTEVDHSPARLGRQSRAPGLGEQEGDHDEAAHTEIIALLERATDKDAQALGTTMTVPSKYRHAIGEVYALCYLDSSGGSEYNQVLREARATTQRRRSGDRLHLARRVSGFSSRRGTGVFKGKGR